MAMARLFLLTRVGRDEEERSKLFIVVKGVLCSRRRREERPGAPGHDRHADGGVYGSTAVRPERGEVSGGLLGALGAPCTMRRRERMDRVHHEPHTRSVNRSVMPTVSHVHRNPSPF
jgi:hypothetical protein